MVGGAQIWGGGSQPQKKKPCAGPGQENATGERAKTKQGGVKKKRRTGVVS